MSIALDCLDSIVTMMEQSVVFHHKDDGALEGLSLLAVHCVDRIGSLERPNATRLAADMRVTRGAISKVSKRLLAKGLVQSYQADGNKKEVYFRLTKSGEELFREHRKTHKNVQDQWLAIFARYSESEQEAIRRFLSDVSGLLVEKSREVAA
jgi:DNA-binding MarR family transcriptional regulator